MRRLVDDVNISREKEKMEDLVSEDLELALFSHSSSSLPSKSTCQKKMVDVIWRNRTAQHDDLVGRPWHIGSGNHVLGSSCTQEDQGMSSIDAFGMPSESEAVFELKRDFRWNFPQKRTKFLNYSKACYSHTAAGYDADSSNTREDEDHSIAEGSQIPTENMTVIYYHSDDDSVDNHTGSDVQGNDGDDSSNSDKDNGEVRMDLTEDLLHMVFSFLSHKDLCKAGSTCKQWHSASTHEDFWRCLNFKDVNITPENFAAICHKYPSATLVNVLGVPHFNVLVMEATASLRRLESLSFGKGQGILDDVLFHSITECHWLKSLTIDDATLGNASQEIIIQHSTLCDLQIIKCRALRISVRCPQLQSLSLKRSSMAHAILICPQLHVLNISSCHKLSDAGIRSATATCPLLSSLDMSFCSCVSDETLREIAFTCPNLQILDASFCPNISLESVRLPMLRDLKLHSCEGISSASVAAISHSYMLEALQLDCCSLLTAVSLDLPHLQNISLVHCRKFVDLNIRSPVFSSLKVSNCPVLRRINISSNALKKLVLQKQESLSTLSLQCHSLQEVDLTECESLKNSVCDIFSDGGGCPMLRSLILDNCESLTKVGLRSGSLVNLSLVGCRAVVALELSCPNLQKVYLDGCDHLERALFCPVGLWSLNLGICPKLSFLQIEAGNMLVLELQGCGILSEATINCPRLLSLDASFCSQLKDDSLSAIAASCPDINSLILSSCLSIGCNGLSSLHSLHCLTLLDLSYTFLVDLQPVFETCSQLKTLRLMACKYLTNSSLDALYKEDALPALRELDLSYSTVGQSAIKGLLSWCTNLTNVNLNGCANLHDLIWSLSNDLLSIGASSSSSLPAEDDNDIFSYPGRLLETLNCVGCPNIKKVVIPPSAQCFHLSKLNLHLSANLKEVDISCPKLISLNLSHCGTLEILKLHCPKLGVLILMACVMLTEEAVEIAITSCSSLETLNLQHCTKIYAMNLESLRLACPSLKRIHSSSLWE